MSTQGKGLNIVNSGNYSNSAFLNFPIDNFQAASVRKSCIFPWLDIKYEIEQENLRKSCITGLKQNML